MEGRGGEGREGDGGEGRGGEREGDGGEGRGGEREGDGGEGRGGEREGRKVKEKRILVHKYSVVVDARHNYTQVTSADPVTASEVKSAGKL